MPDCHEETKAVSLLSYLSQLPFIHPVNDIVASFDGKSVHGVLTFSNKVCATLCFSKWSNNDNKSPAGVLSIDQEKNWFGPKDCSPILNYLEA